LLHADEVHLLPALPKAWPDGYIHGLCARGGFVVDIDWKDWKLETVRIYSKLGKECILRYGETVLRIKTEKGTKYEFDHQLNSELVIPRAYNARGLPAGRQGSRNRLRLTKI
jgi:alpha-L-fucosidase 2